MQGLLVVAASAFSQAGPEIGKSVADTYGASEVSGTGSEDEDLVLGWEDLRVLHCTAAEGEEEAEAKSPLPEINPSLLEELQDPRKFS